VSYKGPKEKLAATEPMESLEPNEGSPLVGKTEAALEHARQALKSAPFHPMTQADLEGVPSPKAWNDRFRKALGATEPELAATMPNPDYRYEDEPEPPAYVREGRLSIVLPQAGRHRGLTLTSSEVRRAVEAIARRGPDDKSPFHREVEECMVAIREAARAYFEGDR